jgi:Fe-S oxidoreductase
VRALRIIGEQVFALTARLGGSMSSEHGDGIVAGEWIEKTYGRNVTDAMRMLKHAVDPDNLLNPKKMFDAPPMDTHLRFGESYAAQTWTSSLHFDHERGLAGAIEQCNGQGVCRKTDGVMCPSYQATRQEQNLTRGRANLLRAFISRPFANKQGIESSVYSALDLCLGCKGCKAECPSGVDMAKLKYEFENQYYKTHRRPLHDYVFGYFHVFAKFASVLAPLLNGMLKVPFFKNSVSKTLGIAEKRPFPKFIRQHSRQIAGDSQSPGEKIIFLSDPFSRYVEPRVEQAAFELLSACRCNVHVLPIVGAGASLLSKGFLDAAKRYAGKVLDALNKIDPQNEMFIVGIEPPEIYSLKNDYFGLLPDRADEVASRSAHTWLLDEYLLRSDAFSSLRVGKTDKESQLNSVKHKIKFQPHCHQRAESPAADGLPNGAAATVELLDICGYEVELLDAGCCGMAGTFGYEAEHYELSMKVGELRLFPLLRQSSIGSRQPKITSTGAACRMQIVQGVGLDVSHPIQLVRDALLPKMLRNM